jgi:23S rRNA (adenine-N6)-dimethyltransferase
MTDFTSCDHVVEVGPGKGIATEFLVKRVKNVTAVEIDLNLFKLLSKSFSKFPNATILNDDFLLWSLPTRAYKLFSNVPFNITADFIRKITDDLLRAPKSAFLILQFEAGNKFITHSLAKNTLASVLLNPWFSIKFLREIRKRNFTPRPNVMVGYFLLKLRTDPLLPPQKRNAFNDFVVWCFGRGQRGLGVALKQILSSDGFQKISSKERLKNTFPSEVSIDGWLRLFFAFEKHATEYGRGQVDRAWARWKNDQNRLNKVWRTRKY